MTVSCRVRQPRFKPAWPAADFTIEGSVCGRLLPLGVGRIKAQLDALLSPFKRTVVKIDPVQFDQSALNLAVNARDAMPNGGRLCITLEHPAEPAMDQTDPGWVHIKVIDTGTGMDEQTQRRIFEPFFTTKEKGTGAGLGLTTCFGIVSDAGGRIHVNSAPGLGTTFTVERRLLRTPRLGRLRGHRETR